MRTPIVRATVLLSVSMLLCSFVACVGANPAATSADGVKTSPSAKEQPGSQSETEPGTKKQPGAKEQGAASPGSSGKPGASLNMSYSPENIASPVGTAVSISIRYRSTTAGATSLTATVTAGAGLSLEEGPEATEFVMDGIKNTAEQLITVQVEEPGLHYVNVFVVLTSNGQLQRRSFAIPVSSSDGSAR